MSEKEKENNLNEEQSKVVPTAKKKTNPWKISFLILIGLLIGSMAFVFFRVSQVREPNYTVTTDKTDTAEGTAVLSAVSTKKQVNALIDFYLSDYQKGSSITYKFYLENEAMLNGTFKVLGYPIQFYLYFDPYVMDNGNIQLKAKSLSIGTLSLPIKDILNFIQRDYKLPTWVEVNPTEGTILLRLDQFKLKNGLYVKAEKINLVDDDIRMTVYIPQEDTPTSSSQEESK